MEEIHFGVDANCDSAQPLTAEQREVLERALAKMVVLGAQVGVDTDQMIGLLESGMTVRELLEYLLTLAGEFS